MRGAVVGAGAALAASLTLTACDRPGGRAAERDGRVLTDSLTSVALGVRKHFVVYLPPSYPGSGARRYPTAYYLHGAGEGEGSWVARGGLAESADFLAAAGGVEMIVVMPDGDDGYWTTWPDSARYADEYASCRRTHGQWWRFWRERAETFCVRYPRYDRFLTEELVARVDARYRTMPGPSHRGIAGASMGGYGAISLALARPDVWGAAASHSGVLAPGAPAWRGPPGHETMDVADLVHAYRGRWGYWSARFGTDTASWWARDPCRRARLLMGGQGDSSSASGARGMPALRIDAGASDPLLGQSRRFRDCLRRLGLAADYSEHPGAHDWAFWRAHVAESLAWLGVRIGAGSGGAWVGGG